MCNKRAFYQEHHNRANRYRRYGEHPLKKAWKQNFRAMLNYPPANVRELDDSYELSLFAPGFEKSDFNISLDEQTLSISVETKKQTDDNWKRQEYVPKGFTREFELNEHIDKSNIAVKYESGVLIFSLPKVEGAETKGTKIEID